MTMRHPESAAEQHATTVIRFPGGPRAGTLQRFFHPFTSASFTSRCVATPHGRDVDGLALSVRVRDAELVRRVPERTSSPRFFAGLEAGVRHRFGAFELSADALLRFLPVNTPYQVLADDRPITLLEPWQLQPGASLDLGYVW